MGINSIATFLKRYPIILGLTAQVLSLFVLRNLLSFSGLSVSSWVFILLEASLSAFICFYFFKLPKWFLVISFFLPLCFALAFHFPIKSQSFYGIGFIFLVLTFSHTFKERVPLYLSNKTTHKTLKKIMDERKIKNVIDLGSGFGGVVRSLATESIESIGVESAPIPWLVSSLLSIVSGKGKILRQNIWSKNLSQYEMVYAFLSPAIMEKLYSKIKNEMRPGSLFISNSFAIPNCDYDAVWVLNDERETQLFIYEIK